MSILGVIVRSRREHAADVQSQLAALAGVDIAAASDGRWVVLLEDHADGSAADTLNHIAALPRVINLSLVYEYSGPDAPAAEPAPSNFQAWRGTPGQITRNHQ